MPFPRDSWLLEDAIIKDRLGREAKWSEVIAVGDRAYVEAIEQQIRGRQQLQFAQQSGSWTLRECYGELFGPENSSISPEAVLSPLQIPPPE